MYEIVLKMDRGHELCFGDFTQKEVEKICNLSTTIQSQLAKTIDNNSNARTNMVMSDILQIKVDPKEVDELL